MNDTQAKYLAALKLAFTAGYVCGVGQYDTPTTIDADAAEAFEDWLTEIGAHPDMRRADLTPPTDRSEP